ncbi:hypothetical protein O7621_08405 [Solwaraspora sp. WMMD937]|uniref:hypothetical protein n=1 Tax=Solwaraspora sp. WMMD937 TaxID=3016090 RepID=UPI00249C4B32|nr:hypothetical protein [Solwaraspora sp. WMMD937]WFE23303.1 hypothetical protein O7621_08405 [Solwaraspora sp. WMMD937]
MNDHDLMREWDSVREYFYGRDVTVNTVLAAHLRAKNLPASGRPWEAAKAAMRAGSSFSQAVAAAQLILEEEAAAALTNDRGQAAATAAAGDRISTSLATGQAASMDTSMPARTNALDWFPKRFGPGDIDGGGARRLLGTPNLDLASVLVREMAQNSWDARGGSSEIEFTLNLRRLNSATIEYLRKVVFTGEPSRTGLPELLLKEEIWALEVSDRGTVGLTGPVRNDKAVDPGEDTNFIDLVLNIGAPRDVHLGGGTYGFGKTISYLASGVGTILIWSRCEGGNGLEHRLIGSAIGAGYDDGESRYTGRHWWGRSIPGEDRVEPVVGARAAEIAEKVFSARYPARMAGTSILILDPALGGSDRGADIQRLAEAVVWNLWPKLLVDQRDRSRMRISVQADGEPIYLPSIEDHPTLSGNAQCLLAVRAAQSGDDPPKSSPLYPVSVHEIWCKLPEKLLGHLALTRFPHSSRTATPPSHAITLMRHQAELVVKSLERRELDIPGVQWAGVFKPVADLDDSFAAAEPPAHDDWVAKAVQDKSLRRDVNVALRRIREAADEWLEPRNRDISSAEKAPSVAHVGDMLSGLVVGLAGSAPSSRTGVLGDTFETTNDRHRETNRAPKGGTSSTRARDRGIASRPKVDFTISSQVPAPRKGWTRTTLDVWVDGSAAGECLVDLVVQVGADGGSWLDTSAVIILGWRDSSTNLFDPNPRKLTPGESCHYTFDADSYLAIDVQSKILES